MTNIYLAGPVAAKDDGGAGWRNELVDDRADLQWLNPLDHVNAPADGLEVRKCSELAHSDNGSVVSVAELVGQDKQMLDAADAVLVGYERVRSVGTPMEVMWAYERGMPVALWVRDGTPFDELSPWYRHHCGCVTNSRELAVNHLKRVVENE